MDASVDDYLEMYGKAFKVNPEQADRVMGAWESERKDAQYAYCAWALVVVGGEPYLGSFGLAGEEDQSESNGLRIQ